MFRPAYWPPGPNARPPGSLRSPSELRPARARPARGSARLIGPLGQTHGLQVRFAHPPKCALTRFARQRRANPASVPVGLLARWAKRTASRSASLPLRTSPRAGVARPGFRMAYFRPAGSKRACSRFASLTLRTAPRAGTARPGFRPAYWPVGPNARPPGPLKRTLRTAPRAGAARPGFRPASRFAPGGRGFLSGADVENRPKRGILKLM